MSSEGFSRLLRGFWAVRAIANMRNEEAVIVCFLQQRFLLAYWSSGWLNVHGSLSASFWDFRAYKNLQ
jgi:hypothetical protein